MIAPKLQSGDEIRIISPANSLSIVAQDQQELAVRRLEQWGLKVSFSANANETDEMQSSSVESRIADLHDAFADPNVKGILTSIGGFNSNQLLRHIDYDLIAANPKRLCGFSDITAIGSAIYAKTGLVTYSGPSFSSFGMFLGCEYTMDYFVKIMLESAPVTVLPSETWSGDAWYRDQHNREFIPNAGPIIINEGSAEGTIIGGNLCTLNLLQGTEYMPSLEGTVVFVEDDSMSIPEMFDRDLMSLIHQPGFEHVQALIIGRFQKESQMTPALLEKIIRDKRELQHMPVIADVDFGHTTPMFTFPIGGRAAIDARNPSFRLVISE